MSISLLTPAQAAALLSMTLPQFYGYRRRHGVPNALKGRTLRFRREDLLAPAAATPPPAAPIDYAELGRQHARGELPPGPLQAETSAFSHRTEKRNRSLENGR